MNLHEELKITALDKFDVRKRKGGKPGKTHAYASFYELVSKISARPSVYIKAEKED